MRLTCYGTDGRLCSCRHGAPRAAHRLRASRRLTFSVPMRDIHPASTGTADAHRPSVISPHPLRLTTMLPCAAPCASAAACASSRPTSSRASLIARGRVLSDGAWIVSCRCGGRVRANAARPSVWQRRRAHARLPEKQRRSSGPRCAAAQSVLPLGCVPLATGYNSVATVLEPVIAAASHLRGRPSGNATGRAASQARSTGLHGRTRAARAARGTCLRKAHGRRKEQLSQNGLDDVLVDPSVCTGAGLTP